MLQCALDPGMSRAVPLLQPAHLHLDLTSDPVRPVMTQTAAQLLQSASQLSPFACDHVVIELHIHSLSSRLNGVRASALPVEGNA